MTPAQGREAPFGRPGEAGGWCWPAAGALWYTRRTRKRPLFFGCPKDGTMRATHTSEDRRLRQTWARRAIAKLAVLLTVASMSCAKSGTEDQVVSVGASFSLSGPESTFGID